MRAENLDRVKEVLIERDRHIVSDCLSIKIYLEKEIVIARQIARKGGALNRETERDRNG